MSKSKTCIAHSVVASDRFSELSDKAKLLYFFLCFECDTDGVIDSARIAEYFAGTDNASLDELVDAGYLYDTDEGVIVLVHQWVHNKKDKRDAPPSEWAWFIAENYELYHSMYVPIGSRQGDGLQDYYSFRELDDVHEGFRNLNCERETTPTETRRKTDDNVM